MVDKINSERQEHIITIEDPIEYLHPHKKCLVNQREVNADTKSFKDALKYILRQDPDVVLVGEMRDLETIEAALTIAETGHLTFATLHTNSAAQTMNRIIDVFPPHQQSQVRAQLSFVLEGIVSQQLIPKVGGGRVLALEVLVPNSAIRNLIREDKIHQVYSTMQTGQSKFGMQTLNQSLYDLYVKKLISYEDCIGRSSVAEELIQMLGRSGLAGGQTFKRTTGRESLIYVAQQRGEHGNAYLRGKVKRSKALFRRANFRPITRKRFSRFFASRISSRSMFPLNRKK